MSNTKRYSFLIVILLICSMVIVCGCKNVTKDYVVVENINVSKWNQETVNSLISNFRIDTTKFHHLKPLPPIPNEEIYAYPNIVHRNNNDLATVWCFINKRFLLINVLKDRIKFKRGNFIEINEFYRFFGLSEFEISNGEMSFRIEIGDNGSLFVEEINNLSAIVSGFVDNRNLKHISPLHTLTLKTIIIPIKGKKELQYDLQTLYIDSGE